MYYTDDPHADFDRHDREQAEWLEKLPVCCHCGEPIQSEDLFDIGGDLYCEECGKAEFVHSTENYIEE